jgi:glucose/arabinose dehydrogenase
MPIFNNSVLDQPGRFERYRGLLIFAAIFAVLWFAVPLIIRYLPEFPPDPAVLTTEAGSIRVVTVTERLDRPWGLAFLPDGDILITELPGRLRRIHKGKLQPQTIPGVPKVETRDQAGLMDIALHPNFAQNGLIYLTYSKIGPRRNTPALARARFDGTKLVDLQDVFVSDAWSNQSGGNTGSRVVFGMDGTLYMSVGDRHEQRPAQDMHTDKGKILRLRDDGSIPEDNPFLARLDARPEIFAWGVRNPQGLFVDPTTGTIWENEHGPRGGDEINILLSGHNYGWPTITYGKNYDGTIITRETAKEGLDQPLVQWTPSIAPSGMTVYTGDKFPAWRGNVFVGALAGQHLRRVVFENGKAVHQEQLLDHFHQRIRDVRQGPDGFLYVLTDIARLLRLEPAR